MDWNNINYLNLRTENIFIENEWIKLFIYYNWWNIKLNNYMSPELFKNQINKKQLKIDEI